MSYIVILMSFTAIFPSIGYAQASTVRLRQNHRKNQEVDLLHVCLYSVIMHVCLYSVINFCRTHEQIKRIKQARSDRG
jgi:Na+-driven multidrug efflux pump